MLLILVALVMATVFATVSAVYIGEVSDQKILCEANASWFWGSPTLLTQFLIHLI